MAKKSARAAIRCSDESVHSDGDGNHNQILLRLPQNEHEMVFPKLAGTAEGSPDHDFGVLLDAGAETVADDNAVIDDKNFACHAVNPICLGGLRAGPWKGRQLGKAVKVL